MGGARVGEEREGCGGESGSVGSEREGEESEEEAEDDSHVVHTGMREVEPHTEEVLLEPDPMTDSQVPWMDLDEGSPRRSDSQRIWMFTLVAVSTAGAVFVGLVLLLQVLSAWV